MRVFIFFLRVQISNVKTNLSSYAIDKVSSVQFQISYHELRSSGALNLPRICFLHMHEGPMSILSYRLNRNEPLSRYEWGSIGGSIAQIRGAYSQCQNWVTQRPCSLRRNHPEIHSMGTRELILSIPFCPLRPSCESVANHSKTSRGRRVMMSNIWT